MIQFEERTERHERMVEVVGGVLQDLRKGGLNGSPMEMMGQVMGGEMAELSDLVLATGGLLPIKTDVFRQLIMYGGPPTDEGSGIPRTLARAQPVKLGLTVMGLAAIASGKGGREIAMTRYLPEILKGKLFCYCITEPDAGTNTNKISTVAVDEGEHFVLNGRKTYISAADSAHFIVVVARIRRAGEDGGIGTFVFEAGLDGIDMTPMDIAVLGDDQFTVYFEDVKVPKDALVGSKQSTAGRGISKSVFYTLNLERIIVALLTLRMCQEALAKAAKKAKEPGPDGDRAIDRSSVQQRLARARLRFETANLASKKATEAYDDNADPARTGMYANMAKLLSTEAASEACELALSLYGVEGLDKDKDDVGSLFQVARALRVIPINNEMVLNFLGENLLGMPKSYR